jgi:hypothetical protein
MVRRAHPAFIWHTILGKKEFKNVFIKSDFKSRLKFYSQSYKNLQYQIVVWADLSFGTAFSGIGRTAGGMATPAAWSAFPATPGSAVLR